MNIFKKLFSEENINKKNLINNWKMSMEANSIYNNRYIAPGLNHVEPTTKGFKAFLKLPYGAVTIKSILDKKEAIEKDINYIIQTVPTTNKSIFAIYFTKEITFKEVQGRKEEYFSPFLNINKYQIYTAEDFKGSPIVIDLVKYPHVLIMGATRSGKSKLLHSIILSSASAVSPKDLHFYFCQGTKSDTAVFKTLPHTKDFATCENYEKVEAILDNLISIISNYTLEFEKLSQGIINPKNGKKTLIENYKQYNEVFSKKQIPTRLLVFDELAVVENDKKSKENGAIASRCVEKLDKIIKTGASYGVFAILSLQRPDADNLKPLIKSMCTNKICFRANNQRTSEVCLDDPEIALGLEQRYFVQDTCSNFTLGEVKFLDGDDIFDFIDTAKEKWK